MIWMVSNTVATFCQFIVAAATSLVLIDNRQVRETIASTNLTRFSLSCWENAIMNYFKYCVNNFFNALIDSLFIITAIDFQRFQTAFCGEPRALSSGCFGDAARADRCPVRVSGSKETACNRPEPVAVRSFRRGRQRI